MAPTAPESKCESALTKSELILFGVLCIMMLLDLTINVIFAVIRIVEYIKKRSKKRLTADAQGFLSDTTLNTLPPGDLYSPSRVTLITMPGHAVSDLNRGIRRQSASDREKIAETREPRRDGA